MENIYDQWEMFHSISTSLSHKATFAVLGNIRKRVCEKLSRVPLGTVFDIPFSSVKNVLVYLFFLDCVWHRRFVQSRELAVGWKV